jgi:hypothetical protein
MPKQIRCPTCKEVHQMASDLISSSSSSSSSSSLVTPFGSDAAASSASMMDGQTPMENNQDGDLVKQIPDNFFCCHLIEHIGLNALKKNTRMSELKENTTNTLVQTYAYCFLHLKLGFFSSELR